MEYGKDIDSFLGDSEEAQMIFDTPHDVAATAALRAIAQGVTITWLMQAFQMDRSTIRKRLAKLLPIRYARGNSPIYSFLQASAYLVKPKMDMKEYISNLNPKDLPASLQKDVWDAKLKRQAYELRASELWRTEDVFEVFGEALKHIKTTVQLWVETVERAHGITQEQRTTIIRLSDALLDELHTQLVAMKSRGKTRSSVKEIDGIDDEF